MSDLVVDNLSIEFGGVKALSNVGLVLKPNTFLGLMGPNGAGKTTLLNCISRIYDPTSGSVKFGDQELLKMSGDQILQLGIARTFQDLNFFNHISEMTILDYVKLGQFNPRETSLLGDAIQTRKSRTHEYALKRKARRVLDFFRQVRDHLEPPEEARRYPYILGREGFPDLLDAEFRSIGSLSFAWRRRLDLVRALASDPKILLLDEPAQGLPPSEISNLGKLLKFVQSEFKTSALIVEHNIELLMTISDEVIVMDCGKNIAKGPPKEVRSNPEVIEIYLGQSEAKSDKDSSKAEIKQSSDENVDRAVRSGTPILSVQNLDLYYGFAQALFSVSLKIYPKEVVAVLGTNGSGKSSLVRAICGVERPKFGEIFCNGEPVPLGWPEAAVERGIQYVPQGHFIFPELSVKENLRIGAYFLNHKGKKLESEMERVFHYFPTLKQQLKVQAASLSGGQRQMLAIGQALLGRPKLLLLDEPSLGLSPMLVDGLFEIIRQISLEEHCAVLIVEQNVAKALSISDYTFLMGAGVLISEGPSENFIKNDELTKKYLGFH